MLTHQGWRTVLYTLHLLASQCFEFEICLSIYSTPLQFVQKQTDPSDSCREIFYSCLKDVKEAAYKGLVRPVLEYGSSCWEPHTHGLQQEKVQNPAARTGVVETNTNWA